MKPGTALRSTLAVSALCLAAAALAAGAQQKALSKTADPQVERGRYLVKVSGCNDCHTAGYAMTGGKVPEGQWLMGDKLGWRGPWGTTYPVNLRLYMQTLTEKQWIDKARHLTARPPMPFWALNQMTEADLRALYRYVRALGPAGSPAPDYVPPNQEPKPPYVTFPAPPK